MTLSDLEKKLFTTVEIPSRRWAMAEIIGAARTKSNEGRPAEQDRGEDGNADVDLWGICTELTLLAVVKSLPDSQAACDHVRAGLFDPRGGAAVKVADLVFEDLGRKIGIDAKSFSCKEGYGYFAINAAKHEQLRGKCDRTSAL